MSASEDQKVKDVYEFGPFRVDPEKETLLRAGDPIPLTPKTFQILLVLVRHSKEVVTKDDLMKAVWPDTFVEEANLSRNIFMLRKALGESPQDHQYILTVPGRGYRLAESVHLVPEHELSIVAANHSKVQVQIEQTKPWGWISVAVILLLAVAAGTFRSFWHRTPVLSEKDTIVLSDFDNRTGDPVFDDTLKQGLSVQLEQSPFLSIISDQQVQQTLQMMGQNPDAKLTPGIAREICQRTGSTAILNGSIAQIGTQYLLTLKGINCASGESLTSSEAQASDKNHVLDALGKTASEIRNKLGESLSTVRKFDTPLEQATTPSLEALKAFSLGRRVLFTTGFVETIPFFKHAIELDPSFALAYAMLGRMYGDLGESGVAADYTRKAYELRGHASEAEKYFITASFHIAVTGNMEKAKQNCELWK